MYDTLTFRELTILQNMLYEGTEESFRIVNFWRSDPDWFGRYRPVHAEIAHVVIEAGTELLDRIEKMDRVQAAA